jgi:hypothetical protein
LMVILVLLAKRIGLEVSKMDFGRSLIYCKKSKGPSMEPGGTPSLTAFYVF